MMERRGNDKNGRTNKNTMWYIHLPRLIWEVNTIISKIIYYFLNIYIWSVDGGSTTRIK